MSEELIKRLHYLQGVADGIEARKSLRGFYVPQDTTDLLEAITRAADQVNTDTVSVPMEIIAYSCANEVAGLKACKQWCGNMKKCVAKLEDK